VETVPNSIFEPKPLPLAKFVERVSKHRAGRVGMAERAVSRRRAASKLARHSRRINRAAK
jgi:hypothetical protein